MSGDAKIELENNKKIRLFDLKTKKIRDLADEFVPEKQNYTNDATLVGNGFISHMKCLTIYQRNQQRNKNQVGHQNLDFLEISQTFFSGFL